MKAMYIMQPEFFGKVFDRDTKAEITALLGGEPAEHTYAELTANPELLKDTEIIFPSYGMGRMDAAFLSAAPRLKAVMFAAGSVKAIVSEEFWERGIILVNAARANAEPVAEYAFAQIILSLKKFFLHSKNYKESGDFTVYPLAGSYRSKVGIISYGLIAKSLCEMLRRTQIDTYVYSPELDEKKAAAEGVKYAPPEALFKICDVVSLHTPLLPQTEAMIKKEHFLSMKPGASFINTARGGVVDEAGMTEALALRPDLTALLDVTVTEPLEPESRLFTLSNVILTPHIAGAAEGERARLGQFIKEELKRYLKGAPLTSEVKKSDLIHTA